ncbi:hypothetical protein BH11BAC4_BH11BAC4_24780 [soil metagenome]
MTETIASIVGYGASILLAISLLVTNDLKFRWLNTFGCLAFIVYGILIHAFPIILTNSILLLINAFYLAKIYRANENFDLLPFSSGDALINKFLLFYKADIKSYFPEYDQKDASGNISFVVLRDMVIANIFSAALMEDGTALVKINYTVPKYRDYKIGKFLFQKEKQFLLSKGIQRLVYTQVFNKKHELYLVKMGFEKELLNEQAFYYKNIV